MDVDIGRTQGRPPAFGYEATREDATAAFAKSWRREWKASGCTGPGSIEELIFGYHANFRRVGVHAHCTTRCALRRRQPPGRRDLIGVLTSSDGTGHGLCRSRKIPVLQLRTDRWSADVLDEPRAG